jgi:hypothetical protein
MSSSPNLKLFHIEGTGLAYPPALAICAPFRDGTNRLCIDAFIFGRLTNGQQFRRGCRIFFPPAGTDTGPLTIDHELAFSEALLQAECDIRSLVTETQPPVLIPGTWPQLRFTEVPLSRLASSWIGGTFKEHIARIGQHTGSSDLSAYIDSLRELPYITRNEITL